VAFCPHVKSPGAKRLGRKEKKMHPFAWWHARSGGACGEGVGCGPSWRPHDGGDWHGQPIGGHGGGGGEFDGGGFGVRRPLRFLAYKLDLTENQVTELAAILNELKTERAQAAVDHRRTTSALADSVAAESFDEVKAKQATAERAKSNERVQGAVAHALGRIHALLQTEQRSKLAYLLRTGALSI
jgi:Spy/CpxP family protein refolding chaperone